MSTVAIVITLGVLSLLGLLELWDFLLRRREKARPSGIWPLARGEYLAPRVDVVLLDSAQIAKRLREVRQ